MLALGQTFVIISSGIDLSVGFVMGLSSVAAAHASNFFAARFGLPPFAAMLAAILSGTAVAIIPGLVSGLLIARLQIPPFIGTLGMYGVARGAAYLLAGGMTVGIANDWFSAIGNGRVYGVPVLVIIAAVACLVLHYMLSQTPFGQHTYALGASKAAAGRAGIDIKTLTLKTLPPLVGHGRHRRDDVHGPIHRRRGPGGSASDGGSPASTAPAAWYARHMGQLPQLITVADVALEENEVQGALCRRKARSS